MVIQYYLKIEDKNGRLEKCIVYNDIINLLENINSKNYNKVMIYIDDKLNAMKSLEFRRILKKRFDIN